MYEIKEWLKNEIHKCGLMIDKKSISPYDRLEYLAMQKAYQTVLLKIKESYYNEPSFCGTCGKPMNDVMFCSQECSEYETLD